MSSHSLNLEMSRPTKGLERAKTARNQRGRGLYDLRDNRRRLLYTGCGLAVVQHAADTNTVNYYAPAVLASTGLGASASSVATTGVGATSVVRRIIGIRLLGFVGRKKMLIFGFSGGVVARAQLAITFSLLRSDAVSYLILARIIAFVTFGSIATFSLFVVIHLISMYLVPKTIAETRNRWLGEIENNFRSAAFLLADSESAKSSRG